jgi:hypothetical protein
VNVPPVLLSEISRLSQEVADLREMVLTLTSQRKRRRAVDDGYIPLAEAADIADGDYGSASPGSSGWQTIRRTHGPGLHGRVTSEILQAWWKRNGKSVGVKRTRLLERNHRR